MRFRNSLGATLAVSAVTAVVTVSAPASAATPTPHLTYSGAAYAAKAGAAAPADVTGLECSALPKLPSPPNVPVPTPPNIPIPTPPSLPTPPNLPTPPSIPPVSVPPISGNGDLNVGGVVTADNASTDTQVLTGDTKGVESTSSLGATTINLGDAQLGISSLDVTATATYSADGGFQGSGGVVPGDLILDSGSSTQTLPLPAIGRPTVVPGVVKVARGTTTTTSGKASASSKVQGLVVTALQTGKKYVLGSASAGVADSKLKDLIKAGEAKAEQVIQELCNTNPADAIEQLAALGQAGWDKLGISVSKQGTGADTSITVTFLNKPQLTLGKGLLSTDHPFGDLSFTRNPDGTVSVGGSGATDNTVYLKGTPLDQIPGVDNGLTVPSLGSIDAEGSSAAGGAKLDNLTVTAIGDQASLVQVDGVDLEFTPSN